MNSRRTVLQSMAAMLVALGSPALALAADVDEARAIVEKARLAFENIVGDPNFGSLRGGLKAAEGVLIFPEVLKGGFFLGGSGGTGVLLVRNAARGWSEPAFYTMGSVSFGLQFGGQAAEIVVLINNRAAVDRLMSNAVKLGADASLAAGPVGQGQAINLRADFLSYAKAKGAFIGMSVEGSVLDVRASLNGAYYGKPVTPVEIIYKQAVVNPHSASLRAAVSAAAH